MARRSLCAATWALAATFSAALPVSVPRKVSVYAPLVKGYAVHCLPLW